MLATYQPDGPPPASLDMEAVIRDLTALSAELKQAGAWILAGHLTPTGHAKVVRSGEEARTADGPYLAGDEHAGGITVIEAPDLDAALGWADKLAAATTLPVEVREFHANRDGLE